MQHEISNCPINYKSIYDPNKISNCPIQCSRVYSDQAMLDGNIFVERILI